jgi:hypothetical protein
MSCKLAFLIKKNKKNEKMKIILLNEDLIVLWCESRIFNHDYTIVEFTFNSKA